MKWQTDRKVRTQSYGSTAPSSPNIYEGLGVRAGWPGYQLASVSIANPALYGRIFLLNTPELGGIEGLSGVGFFSRASEGGGALLIGQVGIA